jgi:uncharacterized protein YifE (UPF0438 family)
MLRTLRLRFADRPDYELAFETAGDTIDPWDLLSSHADDTGRIILGDRESCTIDEVLEVTVVEPKRAEGPTWERGLQDEDVATALDESYEPPS